jgi:hypothetical protein
MDSDAKNSLRKGNIPSLIKEGEALRKELELFGNIILWLTLLNVTAFIGFLIYTIYNKDLIFYPSVSARSDFNTLVGFIFFLSISALAVTVGSLLKFQRLSQSARIYVEEMSDALSWLRSTQPQDDVVEFKIALRQLAGRAELPLSTGRQGYLTFFALNIMSVLLLVTFVAYIAANFPRRNY